MELKIGTFWIFILAPCPMPIDQQVCFDLPPSVLSNCNLQMQLVVQWTKNVSQLIENAKLAQIVCSKQRKEFPL